MKCRAAPITRPYAEFTSSCSNKYRLMRCVASSSACVMTFNRPPPTTRINRLRRSSLPKSMNKVNSATSPTVANGPSRFSSDATGLAGATTSTASGREGFDPGTACDSFASFGGFAPGTVVAISFPKSRKVSEAALTPLLCPLPRA
jgi:hypothetical protein